jgi:hypothetical protein
VLWAVFFLISIGLGYPTLNRYDPRQTGGLSDTQVYYELAVHGPANADPQLRDRVLVPFLARPIADAVRGHIGTWEPVFFAFLIVNSFFTATTALMLVDVANRLVGHGVLAASLYLLNFETANVLLSGMVDSADGCFLMAIVWSLVTGRIWWLPLWGVLGAASKETFVPISIAFAAAWWWIDRRAIVPIISMSVAALATVAAVQFAVGGRLITPSEFGGGDHLQALIANTFDRNVFFMVIWLVPLGIPRLRLLPMKWIAGSGAAVAMALALAVWHSSSAGAAARPMFSAAGPLLSLSAALYLGERA